MNAADAVDKPRQLRRAIDGALRRQNIKDGSRAARNRAKRAKRQRRRLRSAMKQGKR